MDGRGADGGGARAGVRHRARRARRRDRRRELALVPPARVERFVPAGRPFAALRRPHPRHRPAGHPLRPLLPLRGRLDGTPARPAHAVHGRDAGRRDVRESAAALRLLGAHEPLVVPAGRLLEPAPGRAPRRAHGARGDRQRRACAARWHHSSVPDHRHLRFDGDPRLEPRDRRASAVHADAGAGGPRRIHEERPVPVPLLAAAGDGRADPGVGLPALGDDGEGGRVPDGASVPGALGHRSLLLAGERRGHRDARLRRCGRHLPARPEGSPRLLHGEPPRAHHVRRSPRRSPWWLRRRWPGCRS